MFCKNQQGFFRGAKPPQDKTKKYIKHKTRINVQFKKRTTKSKTHIANNPK